MLIDFDWVTIPAGEFLHGDDKRKVYLDTYRIGRTPVTNEQYEKFVDGTCWIAPRHWEHGRIPPGKEQHPVVNVSWYDAQAFCGWYLNATRNEVRLPTKAEWEKAARGTDALIYPWGDELPTPELCNFFGSGLVDTTPVGRYSPQGDSPYGVVDMAGNVWEWCDDWYEQNIFRLLRGGSWRSDVFDVRCARRGGLLPGLGYFSVGFRLLSPGS